MCVDGKRHFLWRVIDHGVGVPEIHGSRRRDKSIGSVDPGRGLGCCDDRLGGAGDGAANAEKGLTAAVRDATSAKG